MLFRGSHALLEQALRARPPELFEPSNPGWEQSATDAGGTRARAHVNPASACDTGLRGSRWRRPHRFRCRSGATPAVTQAAQQKHPPERCLGPTTAAAPADRRHVSTGPDGSFGGRQYETRLPGTAEAGARPERIGPVQTDDPRYVHPASGPRLRDDHGSTPQRRERASNSSGRFSRRSAVRERTELHPEIGRRLAGRRPFRPCTGRGGFRRRCGSARRRGCRPHALEGHSHRVRRQTRGESLIE